MTSRYKEIKLESVRNLRARYRAEGRILVQADLPGDLVKLIDQTKDASGMRSRAPIIEQALRTFFDQQRKE